MSTVTYLILLHNNEKSLKNLAQSLREINCNLRKEYIIVDDASTDKTKSLISDLFAPFPRVTILFNDVYSGPAISINKALKLVQSDYIHFVFGNQILEPLSTTKLIKACLNFGTELAFSIHGTFDKFGNKYKSNFDTGDTVLIDIPIKAVLDNKTSDIQSIGFSGTVIATQLLQKIAGVDESVFLHQISLALRAGKYTKFVSLKETLYYQLDNTLEYYDAKFETYDRLCAIYNFIKSHIEIADCYKPEIYKALWSIIWKLDKYKIGTLPRYILSRYLNKNLNISDLTELYNKYVIQLR